MALIKQKYFKSIKFNNLKLNKHKYVEEVNKSNYINAGIYYFNKKIFKFISREKISLETEILPKLIKLKKLKGKYLKNYLIDIGTPKNLKFAKKNLPKKFYKPGIFFDRDGVINHDAGYTHKFENFRFRKNVIKTLSYLIKKILYFYCHKPGRYCKKKVYFKKLL